MSLQLLRKERAFSAEAQQRSSRTEIKKSLKEPQRATSKCEVLNVRSSIDLIDRNSFYGFVYQTVRFSGGDANLKFVLFYRARHALCDR